MNETENKSILRVELGERGYDILVGEGLLARAGLLMKPVLAQPRVIIVTDDNVAPLYLDALRGALDGEGINHSGIILPAGESTKDFGHFQELTEGLLEAKAERDTTLVALGGGVIGDITGFAAAVTLRGLPFIQIPTTLLAQVDSSVGGKTGINSSFGKNLIGAFHQPRLVLADLGTLDTLARRELLAGYAEVVKYGLIDRPDFFSWLEKDGPRLLDGDSQCRRHAVLTSCAAKAAIVAADEHEKGRRALLNLGHTFGHALEAETGYGGELAHGEAVAIGMVMAFDLSVRLGFCPEADADRIRAHLRSVGLPTDLSALKTPSWTADGLLAHMARDKKVKDGAMTFILARGIGRAFITRDVPEKGILDLLQTALA